MHELIGKKYEYRLVKDEIKTVTDVKGDIVIFDDKGRVPLSRLDEMFKAIDDSPAMTPTAARKLLQEDEQLDPTKFFNQPSHHQLLNDLKKQAEQIDVQKMPEQTMSSNTTITTKVEEPNVKRYVAERTDDDKVVTREENAPLQSADFFKKLKRNTEVTINVKIVEHIPKIDFIKMMDENFDQGILEYLIEDITEKIVSSPTIIQNQVRTQLEALLKKAPKEKKEPKKKKDADSTEKNN